jgi:hypothetical protein
LEADETINLSLSNPQGGAILGTQTTAVLTILNDDLPQRGTINLNNRNYTVNENGTANITLTRTNGSDGEVSVILTPSNGSAVAGDDYTNTPITITFANGETSKTVTIPINNDTIYEPTETVNLTLSNPTGGATLGTQQTATLTIIDNDAVPGVIQFSNGTYSINENGTPVTAVTLTRTNGSDGAVSVRINLTNGTATAGSDYNNNPITINFANGETTKSIIIPIIDDSIVRGNTLKQSIIKMLDRLGPKKLIIVSSAPQIRYPDCYGIDMAKMGDFIAFQAIVALLKRDGKEGILDVVYLKCY